MRKRFLKVAALIACFSILTLYVPGLVGAEKSERVQARVDFKMMFKKPALFLSYFLPFLQPLFDNTTPATPNDQNSTNLKKIRITGGLTSPPRPGGGD
jgi:hypothetical protein